MKKPTIYSEEKKKDVIPIARGKVVWVDANTAPSEVVESNIFSSEGVCTARLLKAKYELKTYLEEKGFVFFDEAETVYRYKLNRLGRLIEFGINYAGIK